MAQTGGSALWVLAAWTTAGLLSLFGALTYAELGAMFPKAGGEYVFLRAGYGPAMGFLFAWNRFWIGTPGSIAAYAVGTTTFLGGVLPIDPNSKVVAVTLVAVFTGVNCLHVRAGGRLQTVLTVMKVFMIGGLAFGALFFAKDGDWSRVTDDRGFPGFSAFGAMVLAALWAYDGWNNLPMAAGEVRDPQRNLPRAIIWGAVGVFVIYALVNLGYFHALPLGEITTPSSTSIAQKTATQFLGGPAQALLAAAMAISAISAMNGSMLTGARVPYAVASDGLAPKALARLAPGAAVPATSVIVQGLLACGYALAGGFDQLTDAVVFASWLFYALNAGTVLLLRIREPDRERAFRVPGFPVVPVIFMALALLLLVNTIWAAPQASSLGLGMTALGALVYAAFLRNRGGSGSVKP